MLTKTIGKWVRNNSEKGDQDIIKTENLQWIVEILF